jgi:ribosomal protein S17
MKLLTGIFVLSKSEQRVIVIVVLALLVGALVRYERRTNHFLVHATATATPNPSPTPPEAEDE